MSDYYIRITDEEPVEMDKGIRFRYDGTGSTAEFTIVDEESYSSLVEQFNIFSTDFERAVNYNLDNILNTIVVPKSSKAEEIVEDISDPNSNSFSFEDLWQVVTNYVTQTAYNSLQTIVTRLSVRVSNLENRVSELDISKVSANDFERMIGQVKTDADKNYATKTQLTNGLSGKANTSHTHGWNIHLVIRETNDLWVNTSTRTCMLKFRQAFVSGTKGKRYTNWDCVIPVAYRPPSEVYGGVQGEGGILGVMWVSSNGSVGGRLDTSWDSSKELWGSVVWGY